MRIEGQKSRVACRGSRVACRGSRFASRERVGKLRSTIKSKGSKFKCLYVSYHSKERSILVGTCWLNTKAIVKRLSLATPSKKCDFHLNKFTSFFRTMKNIQTLIFWHFTFDSQPRLSHPQTMTLDPRHATLDMRPSTCNPRLATLDPPLLTLDPQLLTLDPRPLTLDPRQLPKLMRLCLRSRTSGSLMFCLWFCDFGRFIIFLNLKC